jgi:hypothetical protein
MHQSDSHRVYLSPIKNSASASRLVAPLTGIHPYQTMLGSGSFLSYPQPYVTHSMPVPVPLTSTQQYISGASLHTFQPNFGTSRTLSVANQPVTSWGNPSISLTSGILPSSTSQYILSADNTLVTSTRRIYLIPERSDSNQTKPMTKENEEPSPGRASRPTSLGPLDAFNPQNKNDSVNSSILPFQENRPLMTSPTRRHRSKLKGELVGQRVAEIESDILKRSLNVPKKQ